MAKIIAWFALICSLSAEIIEADDRACVTARHPPVSAATLTQLAYIGIDFVFDAPPCPPSEAQAPMSWQGEALFTADFNSKAEIFRKWMEKVQLRPTHIILIDDGKHHLVQMEKQMAEIGIP